MPVRLKLGLATAALATLVLVVGLVALSSGDEPGEPTQPGRQAVQSAGAFADSVGVNVHLTYVDTAYRRFDRVRGALRRLGVRHVRDGLVLDRPDQYERLRALATDGVRAALIAGEPGADIERLVRVMRSEVRPALAAIEGPNEFDASPDARWPARLRAYQRDLHARVRQTRRLRDLPVWGPSFIRPDSRRDLGDLTGALDAGNLHAYPSGGPPEGNLERERALAAIVSGDAPLVTTETGYHNALAAEGGQPAVTELVAGDYAPRLFLSSFAAGIRRTYWYELVDEFPGDARLTDPESSFGLLRNDFSPKPAATAVANLLRLARGGDDEPIDGATPPVEVRSGQNEVRRLVLRRTDGSYLVALWRPVPIADDRTLRALDARPLAVDVELAAQAAEVRVHRPSRSAGPMATRRDVRRLRVGLAGDATVLVVRP